MAVVAVVTAFDVRDAFSFGNNAIMAIAAIAQNLGVIDGQDRRENSRAMAVFTNVGRLDMRCILAGRKRSVMTANAVAGIGGVIESCRQPASARMAIIAGIATGDVRGVFSGGDDAVVA